MRVDSFTRTLVYGALAAALLPCAPIALGGMLGVGGATKLYLLGVAGLYIAGLAPERRSFVYALVLTSLALPLLAWATTTLPQAAFVAAAVVAIGRLLVAGRAQFAAAWPREIVLGGGGLALAMLIATPDALGSSLALWTFFLVQSLGSLLSGVGPGHPAFPSRDQDPFDRARASLLELLAEEPRS